MPLQAAIASTPSLQPPAPLAADIASQWALDPTIAFLNHGCFGARAKAILRRQAELRDEYEARPIEFLDRRRHDLIAAAREALGRFIGAQPQNLGFVTNATGGINAVLRSLRFQPGDELLTTNHVYNAVRLTMRHLAERAGATYIEMELPVPLSSPEDVSAAIEAALTPRTRIVAIDHVTSPTAIVFPIERIVESCAARGVDVLIDGAHAPGMLPLDIESIGTSGGGTSGGAAYYAGNLHKWICAPSGAAFLWVRPDRQQGINPTTISHFLDEDFAKQFEWQGTRDITPWLCVPDAIELMDAPPYGWERVMRHNHQMAAWVQAMLCERWGVQPMTPRDGSMLGSMATVELPNQARLRQRFEKPEALQALLYQQHRIEAPVIDWSSRWWVRPCCQVYNVPEQYERLAEAMAQAASIAPSV